MRIGSESGWGMMFKKAAPFIVALAIQLVLLLITPLPSWIALKYGKTVILETMPVDPYNIFSGYYAQLRYRISDTNNLPFKEQPVKGHYYFVVLVPSHKGAWRPKSVLRHLPTKLAENEVAIRGKYSRYQWMEYGIEQYYLPENQRRTLEELLRNREQDALVEVKVARAGQAAVVRIRVGGRSFEY